MVPDISLATVAEQFALQNKRVLVLLTDMTSFADALKEMPITMEQFVGPQLSGRPRRSWPPATRRRWTSRGGVDHDPGGDDDARRRHVTHPVLDNWCIREGQFYLRNGRIEPFGSLSRLKQQVNGKTREDHRQIMTTMIRLYASTKGQQEKQSMGFRMSAWDNKLLRYGERFEKEMMDLSVNIPLRRRTGPGLADHGRLLRGEETGVSFQADPDVLAGPRARPGRRRRRRPGNRRRRSRRNQAMGKVEHQDRAEGAARR